MAGVTGVAGSGRLGRRADVEGRVNIPLTPIGSSLSSTL